MGPACRLACLLALSCLAGCEEEIAVDVKVTVPVEVQALYSKEAPGRLMVGMDVPKSAVGWYSLGVLCGPTDAPLVATLHHQGRGCAKAGTVRAWIVPAQAPSTACGLATTRFDSAPAATATVPQGSAAVFPDATGSVGCSSGKAQVEIALALP